MNDQMVILKLNDGQKRSSTYIFIISDDDDGAHDEAYTLSNYLGKWEVYKVAKRTSWSIDYQSNWIDILINSWPNDYASSWLEVLMETGLSRNKVHTMITIANNNED